MLFVCGNGVSSGIVAVKTAKAGVAKGYEAESDAYSVTQLEEEINDFDVVMVAPQINFQEPMIKGICSEYHKPYVLIDAMAYSMLDGDKVFDQALNAIKRSAIK